MARWQNTRGMAGQIKNMKREAVLNEAGRAFGKKGYHNTSLDDIASTLGVSKGTLYNYVKDKQEILFEFHKRALDIGDRSLDRFDGLGLNGAGQLKRSLSDYITALLEELGVCAVLTEVEALRPEHREIVVARRDAFQVRLAKIIADGIADGSIRPIIDPSLAIFTFMGAINWMPRWYSEDGRFTAEQIAESMTDLLLKGLIIST